MNLRMNEHADWLAAYDQHFLNDFFWKTKEELLMKFGTGGASKDFEIVPEGSHVAFCYSVVDLGLQPGSQKFPDPKHQVRLTFELPTEVITYTKDGEEVSGPMSIGQTFTASMNEKANLRKFIESMFGKRFPSDNDAANFEFANLVGRKCLLNVVHNESGGKTYANIQSAMPIPNGMPADFKQTNASVVFDADDPDPAEFAKLPKWLQEKIENRLDAEAPDTGPTPPFEAYKDEPFNDSIPF